MLQTMKIWNLFGMDAHDSGAGLGPALWPSCVIIFLSCVQSGGYVIVDVR